jgi:hypothetical protein
MSVGPGEDLNFLKREFEEFIKGLICLPIKLPGTRLYKSLKVNIYIYMGLGFKVLVSVSIIKYCLKT